MCLPPFFAQRLLRTVSMTVRIFLLYLFDQRFGRLFADNKRPSLPTRLMVGLHYLKHAFSESEKPVVVRLLENPYWQ
ncbi:MAG: hypothetical protein C0614_12705 [Desulfuromonas sp.]|nr:MAG: hypothetical protein C0614_12705 [Desulfuromonas sp.]